MVVSLFVFFCFWNSGLFFFPKLFLLALSILFLFYDALFFLLSLRQFFFRRSLPLLPELSLYFLVLFFHQLPYTSSLFVLIVTEEVRWAWAHKGPTISQDDSSAVKISYCGCKKYPIFTCEMFSWAPLPRQQEHLLLQQRLPFHGFQSAGRMESRDGLQVNIQIFFICRISVPILHKGDTSKQAYLCGGGQSVLLGPIFSNTSSFFTAQSAPAVT